MKCLYCFKPVPKWTVRVDVKRERSKYDHETEGWKYVYPAEMPRTIDDCRKLTNQHVVKVWHETTSNWETGKHERTGFIRRFATWDGEHYKAAAGFFCNNNCAMEFARAAARAGYRMHKVTEHTRYVEKEIPR